MNPTFKITMENGGVIEGINGYLLLLIRDRRQIV